MGDYIATTTRRLRCLGRVVSQGQHKRPAPPWVKELPWLADCNDEDKEFVSSSAASSNARSTEALLTQPEFSYELSEELEVCVKKSLDGKSKVA